jgi:hypothetical protein
MGASFLSGLLFYARLLLSRGNGRNAIPSPASVLLRVMQRDSATDDG